MFPDAYKFYKWTGHLYFNWDFIRLLNAAFLQKQLQRRLKMTWLLWLRVCENVILWNFLSRGTGFLITLYWSLKISDTKSVDVHMSCSYDWSEVHPNPMVRVSPIIFTFINSRYIVISQVWSFSCKPFHRKCAIQSLSRFTFLSNCVILDGRLLILECGRIVLARWRMENILWITHPSRFKVREHVKWRERRFLDAFY